MEKSPRSTQKNPIEEFSPKEKFEVLLTMFGNDKARQDFISLCKEYHAERVAQVVLQNDSENYKPKKIITYSPPQRAELHNRIMGIIAKLSIQSKKITLLQEAVLKDLHSRENVAEAIGAYILAEKGIIGGGGDELPERNKKGMSDTAYFHSLGREH